MTIHRCDHSVTRQVAVSLWCVLKGRSCCSAISQRLTGRKREAAGALRRSASAVDVHLIITKAEIHREYKYPEQGQKRNHVSDRNCVHS